jgi:hypothetical protein
MPSVPAAGSHPQIEQARAGRGVYSMGIEPRMNESAIDARARMVSSSHKKENKCRGLWIRSPEAADELRFR